jgi:hypothetical protein
MRADLLGAPPSNKDVTDFLGRPPFLPFSLAADAFFSLLIAPGAATPLFLWHGSQRDR